MDNPMTATNSPSLIRLANLRETIAKIEHLEGLVDVCCLDFVRLAMF